MFICVMGVCRSCVTLALVWWWGFVRFVISSANPTGQNHFSQYLSNQPQPCNQILLLFNLSQHRLWLAGKRAASRRHHGYL
ncbi:hypothetical protein AOQ84DRAFT_73632 [Glonium stellatum]|uniref:Uncharacterized protein n=1 Tax=Glonium stellatum TaxID=574774 RepID=A0A8E2EXB5_9PEZI|nr:hypothetical protein AOQ84DRAFT_73632 [Glonium stellatum]